MKLKAHHSSEPPLEFMEYNEDRRSYRKIVRKTSWERPVSSRLGLSAEISTI